MKRTVWYLRMVRNEKKERERRILEMVYDCQSFDDVKENECPDFLLRRSDCPQYFGVEITEFYQSETSARLKHIPGYVGGLLVGQDFKHKHDRNSLTVTKVNIIREDGTVRVNDLPAIVLKMPLLNESAQEVAQRIVSKAQRIESKTADVSHVNLIIHDRTQLLSTIQVADFYRLYFTPELVAAIAEAPFREIYLITVIEDKRVYIPLRMFYLLAELYMFNSVVVTEGFAKKVSQDIDDIELFASYLSANVKLPVLIHRHDDGTEVIFGDSGIEVTKDNSVTVKLYSDMPIPSDAISPQLNWEEILGVDFRSAMQEYRKSHTFSSEAVFPIKQ